MQLVFYLMFSVLAAPFIGTWLRRRLKEGKEDGARLKERTGYAGKQRPAGKLLWMHAASVGESVSVLKLLERITARYPNLSVLLTTGTVTSAELMDRRLPERCFHQYVPVDTPFAVYRFLEHWKPDAAFWVESELWPNLVLSTNRLRIPMVIVNGRMSERAYSKWRKRGTMARTMLQCFTACIAQSEADRMRFEELGARKPICLGNLKFDAATLPDVPEERAKLEALLAGRPVWAAVSTHPDEEEQLIAVHRELLKKHAGLLLISIPRHPARGAELKTLFGEHFSTTLRSTGEPITPETSVYIADTIGELGIFYRLAPIVFMGGSLVPHGGQNPLEPARLDCALVAGPHTHNFTEVYEALQRAGAAVKVPSAVTLTTQLELWLSDAEARKKSAANARGFMDKAEDVVERYLTALSSYLSKE